MCKVLGFSNFNKVADKLGTIEYISDVLLSTERDGFGYAIYDKGRKTYFGERTNERDFESAARLKTNVDFSFCKVKERSQNSFGTFNTKNVGAAIFHGRISTNSKALLNVHPIVKHDVALVHNGVVTDLGEKYNALTENDSEHVLERYVDGTFEKNLTGYYAFLAIDKKGKLHVCRDKIASLYSTWSDDLDSYIFSTNEANIKSVCEFLGVTYSTIYAVNDDTLVVFNGNKIESSRSIQSLGYGEREAAWSSYSLGYDITKKYGKQSKSADYYNWDGDWYFPKQEKVSKDLYTENEKNYLLEVEAMDKSYKIFSKKGYDIKLEHFKRMSLKRMKQCTVIRSDGTVMDADRYDEDILYGVV